MHLALKYLNRCQTIIQNVIYDSHLVFWSCRSWELFKYVGEGGRSMRVALLPNSEWIICFIARIKLCIISEIYVNTRLQLDTPFTSLHHCSKAAAPHKHHLMLLIVMNLITLFMFEDLWRCTTRNVGWRITIAENYQRKIVFEFYASAIHEGSSWFWIIYSTKAHIYNTLLWALSPKHQMAHKVH